MLIPPLLLEISFGKKRAWKKKINESLFTFLMVGNGVKKPES